MNNANELIMKARTEYEEGEFPGLLSAISLPGRPCTDRNSFNTIFRKPPVEKDSYDYFLTLRRTAGQNAYIHIPFCSTECAYCSYEKVPQPSPGLIERYLHALDKEMQRKCALLGDSFTPDIFYIGGGTPTLLPLHDMERFLRTLANRFVLRNNREFTVETTPQAVLRPDGDALLALLREHGVNRINVGVQSFSEEVARMNGRRQTPDEITRCFIRLKEAGFEKINLDLIYGLVGQTPELWLEDLQGAVALGPDSLTTFSLRLRPPSRLYDLVKEGRAEIPSLEETLVMRILARQFLPESGYGEDNADYFIRSEEKRYLYQPFQPHNIHRNLIGFGASAYSLAGDRQVFNIRSTSDYVRLLEEGRDPIGDVFELGREEYMRKRFAEGLRTVFDNRSFAECFGVSIHAVLGGIVEKLRGLGLIEESGEKLRLTPRGNVVHDHVAEYIKYATAE